MFDIFFSIILLPVICVVILISCLLVKIDLGPSIFIQHRIGKNGRKFKMYKIRSMKVDSEALLKEYLEKNPVARDEWGSNHKLKNDPRITPIGKIIRKYSIDELPQIINVLKGDMSLVGPRPITENELCEYGKDIKYYLISKPGLTGLWQVSGRSDTDFETRVRLDKEYATNKSFWMDMKIILKTVYVVLLKKGAY